VGSISKLRVPYVYVRGNHDSTTTEKSVAAEPNAVVLDGQVKTVGGLTFAGIGDPRFTPDKETDKGDAAGKAAVDDSGVRLAQLIRASTKKVDVAIVHDPEAATKLGGTCPLVLAGHLHQREIRRLDPVTVPAPAASSSVSPASPLVNAPQRERTLLMVEGSTGGAGLRGLEKAGDPLPLALSILYFDQNRTLQAYDEINVGGTGLTEMSLARHLVTPDGKAPASPSPSVSVSASGSVSASPAPSRS
jgi:hypothetical protein